MRGELVTEGPLEARLAEDDGADLVVIYGGEERGSMGPCGCPKRPRGGLARFAAYRDAVAETAPVLTVNGGYFLEDAMGLDGSPRADVPVMNQWMLAAVQQVGFDAVNLAYNDLFPVHSLVEPPAHDGGARPTSTAPVIDVGDAPLVSANLRGDYAAKAVRVERPRPGQPALRIAVVGISTPGVAFIDTPGFDRTDPFESGKAAIRDVADDTDVVVLLAYSAQEAARRLALDPEVGPHIDVVVDTGLHREVYPTIRVGHAVWVRSHFQTMRVGELRLGLESGEGADSAGTRVAWAVERKVDLDPSMPDRADLAALEAQARADIDAAQKLVFGKSGY